MKKTFKFKIQNSNIITLLGCLFAFACAATDIVPNPSAPGNLGSATNGFPNAYASNFFGRFIGDGSGLTNLNAGGGTNGGAPLAAGPGITITTNGVTNVVSVTSGAFATPAQVAQATNGLGSAAFYATNAFDLAGAATTALLKAPPLKIIHDDDFADDWDYGATEALEFNLANQGVIKTLCLACGQPPNASAPGIGLAEIFANWYGVSVNLCENTNADSWLGSPQDLPVVNNFSHIYNSQNAPNATRSLRFALANSGGGVVWVMTEEWDTLAALLASPGDDLSPLTGWQLYSNNVTRLVAMSGDYPSSGSSGANREHNFTWSTLPGLQCIATLPTNVPVYWCGYTLGTTAWTLNGGYWMNLLNPNSPLWQLFNNYSGTSGRPGWDAVALWFAVYGTNYLGSNYFTTVQGVNTVLTNGGQNSGVYGSNYFTAGAGNQFYVVNAAPVAFSNSLNETIVKGAPAWAVHADLNTGGGGGVSVPLVVTDNNLDNFSLLVDTTTSGSFNITAIGLVRGDYANGYAQLRYGTFQNGAVSNQWSVGLRAGDNNYGVWDEGRNFNPLLISSNNDYVNLYTLQATNLVLPTTNAGPVFSPGTTTPRLWIPFTNGTAVFYLPGY